MTLNINHITEEDVQSFTLKPTLVHYQSIAIKSAIYPGKGSFFGLSYCAHKLAGEAGEFNDHLGKSMRDDKIMSICYIGNTVAENYRYSVDIHPLALERRDLLINELGDCLWYLSALAKELNINLAEVALRNLRKLQSRTERGTLMGDGDKR